LRSKYYVWGIDFIIPFLSSRDNKYILVFMDYASKCIEVIASPTNDSRVLAKLFKKIIFPCFGLNRVLISDNVMHINEKNIKTFLKKNTAHHMYRLSYHPQTIGQVEISNYEIKAILEKTIARSRKGCVRQAK